MQGVELVMSQLIFHLLHCVNSYTDGGVPVRMMVVVEINPPSGVDPGIYNLEVVDEGAV